AGGRGLGWPGSGRAGAFWVEGAPPGGLAAKTLPQTQGRSRGMSRGALAAALLFAGAARGQEAYPVKVKEAGPGDVRQCDVRHSTQTSTKLVGTTGTVLDEQSTSNALHAVYRETVLARDAGDRLPARLRREYQKAVAWAGGKPEELPYQGKAVLVEKGAGGYRFRVEGGAALAGAAARELEREFNRGDRLDLQRLLLPAAPVRVGEEWKIDMAPVARDWQGKTSLEVDVVRSSGSGRLTRVYRQDGRLFGVMAFRLEMPVVGVGG